MRVEMLSTFTACLLWVTIQVSFAHAQNSTVNELEKLQVSLQAALDQVVVENEIPGATLAIGLPAGQSIRLASGFADLESKTPMPVDAQMMVGSTGKTYVSAVALQLITEGKFKLDELADQYFSDADAEWFSRLPNHKALTIRSLMNHTSGLPRYVFSRKFLDDVKENPQKARSPRECLSFILDADPKHDVGAGWGYSDTNYLLLGLIIEKVTGNAFYGEAQTRLLDPLKLTRTIPTTQAKLPGLVQGYIGQSNPFGLSRKVVENESYALNPAFEWCGGGFMASAGDLANWMRALHGGEVLDEAIYEQMIRPVDFRTGSPAEHGYGLGTFVWKTELGDFVGHAGMMPGYLTQIEYSRQHRFSVAFQMNTDQGSNRKNHDYVVSFAKIVAESLETNQ